MLCYYCAAFSKALQQLSVISKLLTETTVNHVP